MLIGIDASRANKKFKTGTEWYSYYLIINLIKIDNENKYVLYSDQPLSSSFLFDLDLEKNTHVKVKVLKWPSKYLWTLARMSLEMIFHRPDALFVPAHVLPFFCPKKTINTIHDIAFLKDSCLYGHDMSAGNSKRIDLFFDILARIFTLGRYRFRSTDYLKWSTKVALKKARRIITVSNFTKEEILSSYPKAKESKITVVYNGYNDQLYRTISDQDYLDSVLKKYGLNFKFFLYVGRLERKKNLATLIEAFATYREKTGAKEKLVLVGRAGYGYDEIKYLIDEMDLENEVLNLGWVEEEDLAAIFNQAEIFIFPSLHEGFGIPVIQAMACNTPVLASDIPALKEVAQEAALFFSCRDTSDLFEKIKKLENSPDLKKELKRRGLEHSQNFSWEKCAQETLEVIKSL